ncbi:hypothetical protein AVEN_235212-1 [Araneus ventricosus]|uniref:CCHC-type domain-containing protein n=1 Tax=Araneus ventricosus TaxID=182803 RepID=A0A4Y2MTG5_ARAVE|nr:hypothetical protein AVEN_235212-1 [Araneus ventricosus]
MNDAVAKIKQDDEAMLKSELKDVVETVDKIKQDYKLMLQKELKNNLIENNKKMVDDLRTKIESVNSKTYAKCTNARNKESRHWVVTIDPSIFKELRLKHGIYFNWSRIRFTEFIGASGSQCRTCAAFGHTAKYCEDRDKPPICKNCSMLKTENHSCRVPKSKNCIMASEKFKRNWHTIRSVFDKRCESYLRQRDILVKRTDYGN